MADGFGFGWQVKSATRAASGCAVARYRKSNAGAWQREKLVLQMKIAKSEHIFILHVFCEMVSATVAPSFIYFPQYDDFILFSCTRSYFQFVMWRCSVSNQRFAHLTDNRATGSNNNNHFWPSTVSGKNGFSRGVLLRVFLFPF